MGFAARYIELRDFAAKNAQTVENDREKFSAPPSRARGIVSRPGQPIFDDMMANEQTSVSRVADREKLPLLLDKARQFAGQYIDSLEERPVFPGLAARCRGKRMGSRWACPDFSDSEEGII